MTMRNIRLVWWIGFLYIAACPKESLAVDIVNIGAIFSLQSIYGKTSRIAMQAAVDDINSDPSILGGNRLALHIHDSNFSSFLSIMGDLQLLKMDIVAVIGPQSSVLSHVLGHIGNLLHIPLLSFTTLDPLLTPVQFPYLVQTAPNDLFQMRAISEMVNYFGWGEVTAIFSDDDESRNGISILGEELARRGGKISYKASLPPALLADEISIENVLNQVKMMESRVIVVHTTIELGPKVLKKAEELEMIARGYVWIASSWLSTILDAQSNLLPERYSFLQGIITLRHHILDSKRKNEFASRWNHLTNGSIGLTSYSFYAYDTIWMLALALNKFWNHGYDISFSDDPELNSVAGRTLDRNVLKIFNEGSKLLKLILETNMTGLIGPIQYINHHRSLFQPSFDIHNVAENQVRLIGYWSNSSGLSTESPDMLFGGPKNLSLEKEQLKHVIWPGGMRKKPRGWVFPDNRRKLKIAVPFRVSFRRFVNATNNVTNNPEGYSIDVFRAALKLLPYPVPYEFVSFGDRRHNPDYDELVNKITAGVFDAAVGDIAITSSRTKDLDFTQPYAESGLVVVVRVRNLNSGLWTFVRPFTGSMWAVTTLFFCVVGAVIWLLEHRINDELRGPPTKQLVAAIWFSFSALYKGNKLLSSFGKMVMVIWLFVVWIIQSSYKASLSSYLTVNELSYQIKGIDSLITGADKIGFQMGSYAESYLIGVLNIPKNRLKALNSPEEYAQALANGTVTALVDERPYIGLFLSKYCRFSTVGKELNNAGWGFAFPRGSLLAVDLSNAIIQLSDDGTLLNLTKKWQADLNSTCMSRSSSSHHLQLRSFLGIYMICGAVCFISIAVHSWKTISKYRRHSLQASNRHSASSGGSSSSSRLKRMKSFLSFIDKRDDERFRRREEET